jgi:hypothetical protein
MHPVDGKNILKLMQTIIEKESSLLNTGPRFRNLFNYVGELNQDRIHSIVSDVETKLLSLDIKKGFVKKTFTILIEGLQNAFIHGSANATDKLLGISVTLVENSIEIVILGITDDEQFSKVEDAVSTLNKMTPAILKQHYLDVMSNGRMTEKGGAGLGLITMVMKSEGGLKLEKVVLANGEVLIQSNLSVGLS